MFLLGQQPPVGTTADFNAAGNTAVWKFVAVNTGKLQVIYAQTKVANATATAIDLGIYDDVAGTPTNRLGFALVESLAASRGTGLFRAVIAPAVAIVAGTTYWLGWHVATEQWDFQGDAVANAYKETSGASDFGNPFPASGAGGTTSIIWGETAPDMPPRPAFIEMRPNF